MRKCRSLRPEHFLKGFLVRKAGDAIDFAIVLLEDYGGRAAEAKLPHQSRIKFEFVCRITIDCLEGRDASCRVALNRKNADVWISFGI